MVIYLFLVQGKVMPQLFFAPDLYIGQQRHLKSDIVDTKTN